MSCYRAHFTASRRPDSARFKKRPHQLASRRKPGSARWRWLSVAFLTLVMLLSASCPARDSEPLEGIRAAMEEGQALFIAGEYQQAAAIFEAGYAEHPYSAFLFNAGVCYQKAGQPTAAIRAFEKYLKEDPQAPDAAEVSSRIEKLRKAEEAPPGSEDGKEKAEQETDRTETEADQASQKEKAPPEDQEQNTMKSLVVVETEPTGAPLKVYRRVRSTAPAFEEGGEKPPGWELVAQPTAPAELTLAVGRYHVVVEKFREFNRSETDIDVSPGHVHHFKANLSQGAFMGFLKVSSNVVGATIFLDERGQQRTAWGQAPHGELVKPGEHEVVVEAPGFEPSKTQIEIKAGEQKELEIQLERVAYGVVRLDATAPVVDVYEGDHYLGTWRKGTPALELRLAAGKHQLSIRMRGYKELRTQVEVPKGRILPVRAQMIEKYPRGAAWTQAVLGAAVLGGSIYLGVESDRFARELTAERAAGRLSPSDPRLDQGFWYSLGADAGFAVGGVLGILSIYNFIKDPYPEPELRRGKKIEFSKSSSKVVSSAGSRP